MKKKRCSDLICSLYCECYVEKLLAAQKAEFLKKARKILTKEA